MRMLVKGFYFVVGTIALILGILGIFLPILPTTPFLLLAAYCYARSSERFHQWLITNRWFGKYIKDYREGRGLPRREKIVTLTVLWLTIGLTTVFVVSAWWGKAILLVIACGVTIHVARLRTADRGESAPLSSEEGELRQQ